MVQVVSKIVFVFLSAWLWRTAGRGGFPNSLWLRRIVFPYMGFLITGNWIASLIFAISLTFPITLIGSDVNENIKNGWIFALSLIHGFAISIFFYPDLRWMFTSCLSTAFLYSIMIIMVENIKYEDGEDTWYLFEYGIGVVFGVNVVLSAF